MIGWLLCLLGSHERRERLFELPSRNCLRCGRDAREWWEVEMETQDIMERLYLEALKKK